MMTEKDVRELAQTALHKASASGASEVEILIFGGEEELSRFARNEIHQSVSKMDMSMQVRFIKDKKIGVAKTNDLSLAGIEAVVNQAGILSGLQRADPGFVSLPGKQVYEQVKSGMGVLIGAHKRASRVGEIAMRLKEKKLEGSGAFSEGRGVLAVFNSHGVDAFMESSSSSLSLIAKGDKGSGFASQIAKSGEEIDCQGVGNRAIEKATLGTLKSIEIGDWEVILEPAAVVELLDFFAFYGANARIFHEDVSFFQGNMGKQILSEKLTIVDDPLGEGMLSQAFDFEGVAKHRLEIVKNGVLTNLPYDSYLSAKYGATNTGHALPAPNTWGPIPTHLRIVEGDKSRDEMIRSVKRGLLVTRFWYTRVIHYKELLLTGMTRDGTFLIEDGKIVARVRNLRYTDSVLNAFGKIKAIENRAYLEGSEGSPSMVPGLQIESFRFTGTTEHA